MPSLPRNKVGIPGIATIKHSHRSGADPRSSQGQRSDREVENFILAIRASALRALAQEILDETPQAQTRAELRRLRYTIDRLKESANDMDPAGRKMNFDTPGPRPINQQTTPDTTHPRKGLLDDQHSPLDTRGH